MNDDEALLAAVVAISADESIRLVYARWLERQDNPRSKYLRSELDWAANRSPRAEVRLRKLAERLDPVWVARVSRPPVGVCCDLVRFERLSEGERPRPRLSRADLDWLESRFKLRLPVDYKAFLLNYNGGHPEPGHFRHDLVTQRFGIPLPAGYHGQRPDWNDRTKDPGPMYGQVSDFMTVWAAADSAPDNAQASGDWSPDLVNNLQLLEHFRSGVADFPAPYWRQGARNNLIWIGHSAPSGMHEVWCLGVRGQQAGRVYHVASHSDHACECDDCLLIAPSLAAFLSLFAFPASRARRVQHRRTQSQAAQGQAPGERGSGP